MVTEPEVELVTMTDTEHEEFGATTDAAASKTKSKPIVAVAVPGLQFVEATELKFTNPGGYTSINSADKVADTSA